MWHPLVWEQRKVSEGSHLVREVVEERRSLDVQVSEHGIGTPATEELNAFFVNASAEEGHCTTGPEASGLNVGGGKPRVWGPRKLTAARKVLVTSLQLTNLYCVSILMLVFLFFLADSKNIIAFYFGGSFLSLGEPLHLSFSSHDNSMYLGFGSVSGHLSPSLISLLSAQFKTRISHTNNVPANSRLYTCTLPAS